jgi:hypothetical protein
MPEPKTPSDVRTLAVRVSPDFHALLAMVAQVDEIAHRSHDYSAPKSRGCTSSGQGLQDQGPRRPGQRPCARQATPETRPPPGTRGQAAENASGARPRPDHQGRATTPAARTPIQAKRSSLGP